MSCKKAFFNGWGDCNALMENMVGAVLQYKGETFTDAQVESAAVWQTAIADDSILVRNALALSINSFVPSTDAPTITASPLGKKFKTMNGIPSGVLYLDASLCDYKQLHALQGRVYEFTPFFDGGGFWRTLKTDGTNKGFRVRIATVAGFKPDDATQSYPLHVFFDSYNEFEKVLVYSPSFSFTDVFDYSPAGLDVKITTAYTGGDVVVLVTKRGSGDAMTGLVAGDFITVATTLATTLPAAVTVLAENGQGSYTLTIKKDTGGSPANLAATDTITLQAQDDDATNLTYLSHAFDVVGGA